MKIKTILATMLLTLCTLGCSTASIMNTVKDDPNGIVLTSDKNYVSFIGNESLKVVQGDQGISYKGSFVGVSKGPGFLTQAWNFVKGIIYWILAGLALWLVLSVVGIFWAPAGVIAGILAGVATGGLAFISGLITWFKNRKTSLALEQTVSGIDALKAKNPELKETVNNELKMAQDTSTKNVIDKIRK